MLYKNVCSSELLEFESLLIKKKAFEAMVADVNSKIHNLKFIRLRNEKPKETQRLLEVVLSKKSLFAFCISSALILISLFSIFNVYQRKSD